MKFPPIEIIKDCLALDSLSPSGLRWVRSDRNKPNSNVDQVAGYRNEQGYYKVQVLGREYPCHQIVLWLNGIFPSEGCTEVDHIDRNPSNNTLRNLRWADRSTNIKNRSTIGVLGWPYISPAPPSGKRAKAQYKHPRTKKKVHVGTFDDPYEAHLNAIIHRLENHWID